MKPVATIAGVLFALVALAHLARLVAGWEILVNGFAVPMWISVVGVLVPGVLSVLLWKESAR